MRDLGHGQAEDLFVFAGQLDFHHAAVAADGTRILVEGDDLGLPQLIDGQGGAGLLQKSCQPILVLLAGRVPLALGKGRGGGPLGAAFSVGRIVGRAFGIAAGIPSSFQLALGGQLAEGLGQTLDDRLHSLIVTRHDSDLGLVFGGHGGELGEEFGRESFGHCVSFCW